jgi:hypothetical protein
MFISHGIVGAGKMGSGSSEYPQRMYDMSSEKRLMIERVDGGWRLSSEGHSPYPENPYSVWWPALRKHPDGTTWGSTLTKEEVLARLEKEL